MDLLGQHRADKSVSQVERAELMDRRQALRMACLRMTERWDSPGRGGAT